MTEPFPLLSTSVEQLHNVDASHAHKRRPRKSSAFGSDIRAGDTGAPALASSRASINAVDASNQVGTHARMSNVPLSRAAPVRHFPALVASYISIRAWQIPPC